MRARLVVVFLPLLVLRSAVAYAEDVVARSAPDTPAAAVTQDGLFVKAAAVPARGVLRAVTDASSERAFGAGLLVGVGGGFATEARGRFHDGEVVPDVNVRWQWLRQDRAGLDVMTAAHFGVFSGELPSVAGGQVAARVALGRSFGRLRLALDGLAAMGVVEREDIDAHAASSALYHFGEDWRAGVEGRLRTELRDEYKTDEDEGRPLELRGGGVLAKRWSPIYVQAFGGWTVPRGRSSPGPLAMLTVTYDL